MKETADSPPRTPQERSSLLGDAVDRAMAIDHAITINDTIPRAALLLALPNPRLATLPLPPHTLQPPLRTANRAAHHQRHLLNHIEALRRKIEPLAAGAARIGVLGAGAGLARRALGRAHAVRDAEDLAAHQRRRVVGQGCARVRVHRRHHALHRLQDRGGELFDARGERGGGVRRGGRQRVACECVGGVGRAVAVLCGGRVF